MTPRPFEQGAALIAVLLLVAVMGALAAAAFDRLRIATAVEANAAALDQARAFALAGELIAARRIDDLQAADPQRTTLAGDWQGRTFALPLPIGTARARVVDGGNCFNLNSVVQGAPPASFARNDVGIRQFTALGTLLGVPPGDAQRIAAGLADWIDADQEPLPDGAEDSIYQRAPVPYRTGGTLIAEVSELRAVAGVTPAIYARLRPWLCALPVAEQSQLNINTLLPVQAPLLAMLQPELISLDLAQRAIAARPATGWPTSEAFLAALSLRQGATFVTTQLQTRTRWFALDMGVEIGEAALRETALIDASRTPARIVARRWTADE
jgi:general secretion pathway protein K